jgi:CheY-like chemotaxis protein
MSKEQPKILIVEDEPEVCNYLQSFFGRRGFLVSTTPSGKEALSIIKTSKPEVVLLDLKLAGGNDLDGVEVLKTLRQHDKETKVIIITGQLLNDKEIEKIRSLGITGYLHKPVELQRLQNILESILGGQFPSEVPVEITRPIDPQDTSLSSIGHELSNLLGIVRSKCENFILDIEDGIYKDKSDKELVKIATEIMDIVLKTIDRATGVVNKISVIAKKNKFQE